MCCLEKQQNSAGKQDAGELNIVPDLLTTVSMAERMTLMVDRPSCVSSWFDRGEKGARAGMVPFAQTKYMYGENGACVCNLFALPIIFTLWNLRFEEHIGEIAVCLRNTTFRPGMERGGGRWKRKG